MGNWFSFPSQSHCENDGPVGVNNCQWRVLRRVKTIDATCLESNSFLEACRNDNGFPYTTASALFVKAFESDDPALNGCPPVYPSDSQLTATTLGGLKRFALSSSSTASQTTIATLEEKLALLDHCTEKTTDVSAAKYCHLAASSIRATVRLQRAL
jgi:hypothetical protein